MRRGLARLAAVGGAAALGVGAMAGTAAASTSYYLYYGGNYVAYGEFQSNGDVWTVCDMRSDGRGAQLDWVVVSTGRTGSVRDSSGYGTCAVQNVNIGEGNLVQYRVCLVDNGVELGATCGGWATDRA